MAARWDLDAVRALDRTDPIAERRSRFLLPPDTVYLDGNSLGALSQAVGERVHRTVADEWGAALVTGWDRCGWMEAPQRLGDRIAPLIGALQGEVLVADTTSVALAKLVGAALAARPERRVVVSSTDNFPSDLYAAAGAARLAGATLRIVEPAELPDALDDRVAVCCLTHVDFRTGALHDIASLTARTHEVGALALWDLCHSAGVLRVGCEEHRIDLAVGCTYKYLNGGPGSPSFLYVRRGLQAELENPLPGWLGHATPFAFEAEWRPATGIGRFTTSTPPVVALAALDAALDVFDGVPIEVIRAKSVSLGQLFIDVVQDAAVGSLEIASPQEPTARGSQVSLRHGDARQLVAAALQSGVVCDFRAPDLCRFGFAPLYLRHEDVFAAAWVVVDLARAMAGSEGRSAARQGGRPSGS